MPMRDELPDAAVRPCPRSRPAQGIRSRTAAAISNPDLQAIGMLSAIGFLTTINVVLYFPNFGEVLGRLTLFP